MTLTTGTLELKGAANTSSIYFEIRGTTSGTACLTLMSNEASPTVGSLPTGMRDFAGHTQGSIPNAPTLLTAAYFVKINGIRLLWTDNSTIEDGFKIERSNTSPSTNFLQIGIVPPDITSYNDSPSCGQTYWYRVRAYNGIGNSAYTNVASAYMDCGCLLGGHSLMISPNEFKKIEDINIGDLLYTVHQDDSNVFNYYKVYKADKIPVKSYYLLKFGEESIRCSTSHKLMCADGQKKINDIEVGDKVLQFKNGIIIELPLTSKLEIFDNEFIYKIEVDDAHTYITEDGIVHHNLKIPT